MGREIRQKKKLLSDNAKAGILRWWIAGMCYFFIGFGTQAGLFQDPIDLIFFLGVGVGLATIVVYNPIAYGMFDIVRKGKISNKAYYERKGWQNAMYRLAEIFKSMLLVGLVYLTYQGVNLLLNQILGLPADRILIPGEPFGFATLYLIYYKVLEGLMDTVREAGLKGGQQHE